MPTGLSDSSLHVMRLYDVFHGLDDPGTILDELHRVLKPSGVLSLTDRRLKEAEIISMVTGKGLFKLSVRDENTCAFIR